MSGTAAERFARMNVGEVDFNRRDGNAGDGVAQGNTGMRVGPGIDQHAVDTLVHGKMDAVDQRALMV